MSLLPTSQELKLLGSQVEEALNLFGTPVSRFRASSKSMYDDKVTPGDGDQLKVLLEENPSRKLLNSLGWWTGSVEDGVLVVYIPLTVNGNPTNPQRDDLLVFPDRSPYRVQEINRTFLNGVWYVLKCNHYVRDERDVSKEKVGTKSTFLSSPRKEVL